MSRSGRPSGDSPPGRLIDVGGYRLHLLTMGEGSPTVLFESGGGDTTDIWSLVQPEVARFTRACSYDRAGLGWSDRGPAPRTSHQIVKELRALLARADIEGPYVLVAHSWGGMHTNLFARLFPEEVAGMVLVDSIHVDHYDRIPPLMGPDFHDEMVRKSGYPEDFRVPEDIRESIREVRSAGPLPDLPLIAISAGSNDWALMGSPFDKIKEAWIGMHAQYASSVTHGKHIVDAKSGHKPHRENPQLVVDSIQEIVEATRRQKSPFK